MAFTKLGEGAAVEPIGVETHGTLRIEVPEQQEEPQRREDQHAERAGHVLQGVRGVVDGVGQHPVEESG